VVDAVLEGVVEAALGDRAGGTDPLGHLDTNAVAGKEGGRGLLPAVAGVHPVVVRLHVGEGTEEGRKGG